MGLSGRLEQKCLKEEAVGNLSPPWGRANRRKAGLEREEKEARAQRGGQSDSGFWGLPIS